MIRRNSLIRVYTFYHTQESDQGLHCLPFFLSIINKVYTVCHSQQADQGLHYCHSQQSGQGLHHLTFSAVWSRSRSTLSFSGTIWSGSTLFVILKILTAFTLFAILSSLNNVYTVCHSQQSDQGLHYLPFAAVWSGSILFAIQSKQYYQSLHCLPFSAVWSGLHFTFSAV